MRLVRAALALIVLAGAVYVGVVWVPPLTGRIEALLGRGASQGVTVVGEALQPSPEIADATLDRFERFRRGGGAGRLALGGDELSSVVRYALPGLVPPGVADPTVRLRSGRVYLTARVAVEAFPRLSNLSQILALLPDTVLLEMEGSLVRIDQSFLALVVEKAEASRVPIPRRMVADVLAGLGRDGPASLPSDALLVPIPDGVTSVSVLGDSLVLEARR